MKPVHFTMQMLKRMYAKLTSHSLAPTPTRVDARDCGLSFEQVADTRAPLERANICFSCFLCILNHYNTNQTKKQYKSQWSRSGCFFGRNALIRLHNYHKTPCCLFIKSRQHIAQGLTIVCAINLTIILKGGIIIHGL